VDDVLLFSLEYEEDLTDEEIEYTVDKTYFPVHEHCRSMPSPVIWRPVRFSVSHLAPYWDLPTRHAERSRMYYNRDINGVLRAFQSSIHVFGHTHETLDHTVAGVRYVNRCIGYDLPKPAPLLDSFIVEVPEP
jgi:hypothetical protein